VLVEGWAHNVRQGGKKLWFIELRDGTDFVQAVLNGTENITRESTLAIYGVITRPPGTNVRTTPVWFDSPCLYVHLSLSLSNCNTAWY
jgi:aspartyl/asparaginyl-tRNA synthetase